MPTLPTPSMTWNELANALSKLGIAHVFKGAAFGGWHAVASYGDTHCSFSVFECGPLTKVVIAGADAVEGEAAIEAFAHRFGLGTALVG